MRTPNTHLRMLSLLAIAAAACSSSTDIIDSGIDSGQIVDAGDDGGLVVDGGWTYYHDVQPIVQTKCAGCHSPGGIAPFPLLSSADVVSHLDAGYDGGPGIITSVMTGLMPPWPPSSTCNKYQYSRTLTSDETTMLLAWGMSGAPAGDPNDQVM